MSGSGPKVKVTELTSEHIKFILYDCDLRYFIALSFRFNFEYSVANSLRRIMIAEVPTIGIPGFKKMLY